MSLSEKIAHCVDFFYIKPLPRLVSRQIFRYALCGAVNMALDLVWFFLVYHYVVSEQFIRIRELVISPHVASLLIVFPITFGIGFWLNRHVVFLATEQSEVGQLFKYALSVVGSLFLNYICIKFFVETCGVWPTPAKALTTMVCVAYSYLAGRYFTFTYR